MFNFKSAFSILLFATAAALSGSAFAHAVIKQATPAPGATLDAPPKEVVLVFNEKIEGAFSLIRVVNSSGKDMATAKARVDVTHDRWTYQLAGFRYLK